MRLRCITFKTNTIKRMSYLSPTFVINQITDDMPWIYLILASVFEIGWPLGFKLSQTTQYKWSYIVLAIISMGLSGYFLWMAQKSIPFGTAYAIWTGLGAVGTLFIGILFFKDPISLLRLASAFLIITGVIGLKIAH